MGKHKGLTMNPEFDDDVYMSVSLEGIPKFSIIFFVWKKHIVFKDVALFSK